MLFDINLDKEEQTDEIIKILDNLFPLTAESLLRIGVLTDLLKGLKVFYLQPDNSRFVSIESTDN